MKSEKSTVTVCTETGEVLSPSLAICHTVLTPQETLPALGHTYQQGSCTLCGEKDPDFLLGDADGDKVVTYMDAMIALQIATELLAPEYPACDVDFDGKITYLDAMQILRIAVGLA